jgi:hypothetical protein
LVSLPDSLPKLPIPMETSPTKPKVSPSAKLLIPLETSLAKPKLSSSEERGKTSREKTTKRPVFRRGYLKL